MYARSKDQFLKSIFSSLQIPNSTAGLHYASLFYLYRYVIGFLGVTGDRYYEMETI